jgi:hypothetical protein
MFYVEFLRARNCLRILAIVFGIFFAIAVIVRLFMPTNLHDMQTSHWVDMQMNQSGVHTSTKRLTDGSTRTTIVDPDGDRVVVTDHGYRGQHVTVTGPNVNVDENRNVRVASVGIHTHSGTNGTSGTVDVDTDEPVSLMALMLFPCLIGLIIATILGGVLAKENRNHLEIVWTRPVSRTVMALGMFGVDALALVASMMLTMLLEILGIALFELPRFDLSGSLGAAAVIVLCVFAWYGLLTASSASLRGSGGIKALAWIAGLFVPAISAAALVPILIFRIIGDAAGILTVLDPLAYLHHTDNPTIGLTGNDLATGVIGMNVVTGPAPERALLLLVLTVLYVALAVYQWRRLEA